MKIEKISDNQIKCTLTRSDLASRQLKLGELAYGTEKARGLFQDMMEQANAELGFETSDEPLMIEAIPVSMDCIILMITKVDDPEEIDSRYSTMTSAKNLFGNDLAEEDSFASIFSDMEDHGINDFKDFAKKLMDTQHSSELSRVISFDTLETVLAFSRHIRNFVLKASTLYKSSTNGRFYLHLQGDSRAAEDFARICTCALEFGSEEASGASRISYMNEHFETLLADDAVKSLAYV